MAIDFTNPAWTEVDPGNDITVTASRITATAVLSRQDTFYVNRDIGVNYFDGDFTHKFEIEFSSVGVNGVVTFWMLANSVNDVKGVIDANEDCISLEVWDDTENIRLRIVENGSSREDTWAQPGPLASTTYYITVVRDDGGGVNNTGRVTAYIRTGSHAGALQDTLTLDSAAGEQNDFRYIYGMVGYDDNNNGNTSNAFTQNLDFGLSDLTVNDTSHAHTADSPSIIQILSILAVNDSSHVHTADSPTLLAIYDLLVNDASHVFTADSPLLVVYLAVLDAIHTMSADSPILSFIPAETLRMIFTGKVPGVNYTASVPKVQLTGRKPGVEYE